MIIGETGSFGNAVLKRSRRTDFGEMIRIISKDEKKQEEMRHETQFEH